MAETPGIIAIRDSVLHHLRQMPGVHVATGEKELAANDSPPRYVWSIVSADETEIQQIGGNPECIAADEWTCEVECWGETLEEAILLRQVLITAIRDASSGANCKVVSTEVDSDRNHTQLGHRMIVNVRIIAPVERIKRPFTWPCEFDRRLQHVPTSEGIDPGTPVDGDGYLDAPNDDI